MRLLLTIGLLCLSGASSLAASAPSAPDAESDITVTVTVNPPVFPFHKQTHFTVAVEHPAQVPVTIPELGEELGALMIMGPAELKTEELRDGRLRTSKTYTLEAIWAGDYPVKPVQIQVEEGSADARTITVPSPAIRVRDLTEEETAAAEHFEPNAGPMADTESLLTDWRLWLGVGILVILTIVAVSTYLLIRRRDAVAPPPASPWEVAYARLRDLDARQLPQHGDVQTYYVELSHILRHYIEDRFQLHAPEQTTPEFLSEASNHGAVSDAHQKLLGQFLRHCDRVKFARYQPTAKEMDLSLAVVLRFVDETVPAPAPADEENAA